MMADRFLGVLAIVAMMAYAAGSIIALVELWPDMFMRMGAAGVAAGIFYYSRKLKDHDAKGEFLLLKIAHEMNAGAEDLETTIARYRTSQAEETRQWQRNLFFVVIATLQWGFGDLLVTALQGASV